MNITLLVNDETLTYSLSYGKVVDDEQTLLCLKFDTLPSYNEIKAAFLKHFNISGSFDEFVHSIDINRLLQEENSTLFNIMLTLSYKTMQLFDPTSPLYNKMHKLKYQNSTCLGSFYKTKPFNKGKHEMFLPACGDPCQHITEARFDNTPKSGEVLRYLPIYLPVPDPQNLTGIKAEYRGFINEQSCKNHFSFYRAISKEKATFVKFNISELKDFSILRPDLNNLAHRKILATLPSLHCKCTQKTSLSFVSFFARRFNIQEKSVCAFPHVDDFIKYYLLSYLNSCVCQADLSYWQNGGQGELLAAGF